MNAWRRRAVERAFISGYTGGRGRRARARLRHDARAREHHERLHAPLRALTNDDVSPFELDEVGAWLAHDLSHARTPIGDDRAVAVALSRVLWVALGILLVAGLGWRGWDRWRDATHVGAGERVAQASGWRARGGDGDPRLALEALCGPRMRFARPNGCELDGELTFAFALDPDPGMREAGTAEGQLVLFGLDGAGEVAYYAPTPDGSPPVLAPLDDRQWRSVGFGVRLNVNHAPGPLRVFALWTTRSVTAADVDGWAARLRADGDGDGDQSWVERAGVLGGPICPSAEACAAAQLELTIRESAPDPGN